MILLAVLAVIAVAVNRRARTESSFDKLRVGDCFIAPDTDLFNAADIDEVSCSVTHNHEVYAMGTATGPITSGTGAASNPDIVRICRTEVPPGVLAALARSPGVTAGVVVDRDKPERLICTANTASRTGSLLADEDGDTQQITIGSNGLASDPKCFVTQPGHPPPSGGGDVALRNVSSGDAVAEFDASAYIFDTPTAAPRSASSPRPIVPEVGVEPTRPFGQRILSPPRLPFRHSGK